MTSGTVPTPITDVNGKNTIVYRKVGRDADGKVRIVTKVVSSVTTESSVGEIWSDVTEKLNEISELWNRTDTTHSNEEAAALLSSGFGLGDVEIEDTLPQLRDILSKEEDFVDISEPHYRLYLSPKEDEGGCCYLCSGF